MTRPLKKIQNYIIDFDKMLGQGNFAQVFECQRQQSKEKFAVKIVAKNKIESDSYLMQALRHELVIHNKLKHPNIVRFIEVLETQHNFYIVQELCTQGTIRSLLQKKKRLEEAEAIRTIESVCLAFSELLKSAVLHRDLKPQNLLIHQDTVKLADFGLAKKVHSQRQLNSTVVGTPLYMSPQILQGHRYSSKCDIWSLGIIFYELLLGNQPWQGNSQTQLVSSILNKPLSFPPRVKISDSAKKLITETLKADESQRISWIEVFEHQVFEGRLLGIAQEWRDGYNRAAEQLDRLAQNVQAEQLIGVFFRFEEPTLDFDKFSQVMEWLIPGIQPLDLAIMYELFDKDFNGVIDIEEFVGQFDICDPDILILLRNLIEKGYSFVDLQRHDYFLQASVQYAKDNETIDKAYELISNIVLL